MRTALVYDRINKWGGAERLLLGLASIFPSAPIYTSFYEPNEAKWADKLKIYPAFVNRIRLLRLKHQHVPFLMPFVFESFDFSGFDVVISISSAEAKGIITRPETLHICYCLTPTRYLYSHKKQYLDSLILKKPAEFILSKLQKWDQQAAQRPDEYVSISAEVRRRLKKYYNRDSRVIYPPLLIDTADKNSKTIKQSKQFLVVSRLETYKNIELVIKTFNQTGEKLVIAGTGSLQNKLKGMAKSNITFTGRLTDDILFDYYKSCTALIMPQEEDFGLVALEAQFFNLPVIAYKKGGALETIADGKTGVFFDKLTVSSLQQAIEKAKAINFNKSDFKGNIQRFSFSLWQKEFSEFVRKKWIQHQKMLKS